MTTGYILTDEDDGWRLLAAGAQVGAADPDSDFIADGTTEEVVEAVCDALIQRGAARANVIVAPGSQSCYCVSFSSDVQDRTSLLFEMEASLPIDAESTVADYSFHDESVTGVSVEAVRWRPLIDALESSGLTVLSVVPLPILATAELIRSKRIETGNVLVWSQADRADLMVPQANGVMAWRSVTYSGGRLPLEQAALQQSLGTDASVTTAGLATEYTGKPDIPVTMLSAAAATAGALMDQRWSPWYELRRDGLASGDPLRAYRGPLRLLLVTTVLLLITVTTASWVRKSRLDAKTATVQQAQQELFRSTFPGVRVSEVPMARLRSEHRKAKGSRQTGKSVPRSTSAVVVLDTFLKGIAGNIRYQMSRIVIENGTVRADLRFRSHNDAGKLAAALEDTGFSMLPPGTQQLDPTTVTSQLEGRLLAEVTSTGKSPEFDAKGDRQ